MSYQLTIFVAEKEVAARALEVGQSCVLGREPPCDMLVPHDSISRRHCELTATAEGVRVTDLGSSNGLYVDDERVSAARLCDGSEVRVGAATLRLTRSTMHTGLISNGEAQPPAFDPTATTVLRGEGRAYRRLEKERLALLIETGKSLGQSVDLEELLDRIVDHLFQILPVRRAVIALTDDGEEFVPRKVMPPHEGDDLSAVASQGILRSVARSQQGRIFDDAANDRDLNVNESIVISNIRAAICAPILFNGRCLGAIYADYPGRSGLYRPADLDFLTVFASIAAVSLENSRMIQALRAQERLRRDLEVASDIQKGLLPSEVGTFPGLEIDWTYWPSALVGGDFVDIFQIDDGRIVALLGDVSGKSVPAAIYMARTLSMLRAALATVQDPGRAMTRTNDLLGQPAGPVLFATTFIAVIDPGARKLQWCSAGHNPVLIRDPAAGTITRLDARSPPIGVVPEITYETLEQPLASGSLVSIYTDGLVEARAEDATEYGLERLCELIHRHAREPLTELTAAMLRAVRNHIAGSPYVRDDVCILNLRLE